MIKLTPHCQFRQCVYTQLLCAQIPKAQKASWVDCLFCAFGICSRKSCAYNVGEIDPWSLTFVNKTVDPMNFTSKNGSFYKLKNIIKWPSFFNVIIFPLTLFFSGSPFSWFYYTAFDVKIFSPLFERAYFLKWVCVEIKRNFHNTSIIY